ncbi:MAG: dihydroorotate dehydrogenase electron transfer subunit, partial [Candidatus Thermoplasmatota archaeon]|nr:dihydroorotate dehydrogenase electron transfer subunit [Candidatus Thermoplasmatota archaeon]
SLKERDKLWIRGPLGNGFHLSGKKILVVGGGCGTSPLTPLVELAASNGLEVETAIGAVTAGELLMVDRLSAISKVHLATDDGTRGHKGFVTEIAGDLLASGEFDMVYTCGPEKMMAAVVERCRAAGIPCQASLERYMKCGIGICDSCAVSGIRVCADGPVFTGEELAGVQEFGRWRRGPDGSRMPL